MLLSFCLIFWQFQPGVADDDDDDRWYAGTIIGYMTPNLWSSVDFRQNSFAICFKDFRGIGN